MAAGEREGVSGRYGWKRRRRWGVEGAREEMRMRCGEGASSQVVTSSEGGRSSQPDDDGAKNISVSHTLSKGSHVDGLLRRYYLI